MKKLLSSVEYEYDLLDCPDNQGVPRRLFIHYVLHTNAFIVTLSRKDGEIEDYIMPEGNVFQGPNFDAVKDDIFQAVEDFIAKEE